MNSLTHFKEFPKCLKKKCLSPLIEVYRNVKNSHLSVQSYKPVVNIGQDCTQQISVVTVNLVSHQSAWSKIVVYQNLFQMNLLILQTQCLERLWEVLLVYLVYEASLEKPIITQQFKSFSAIMKLRIHYCINKIPTLKISVQVSEAQNILPRFFSYLHALLRTTF